MQPFGDNYLEWNDINDVPSNWLEVDLLGKKFFKNKVESEPNDTHDYKTISKDKVQEVVEERSGIWKKVTNQIVWKLLRLDSIYFQITDWNNEVWKLDCDKNLFFKASDTVDFDISIASQPLWQAFKMPFGIQTLGVSGRYKLSKKFDYVPRKWKKIRILSSLYNAEIYLSIVGIFSRELLAWIWKRRQGLISQIFQQLRRF